MGISCVMILNIIFTRNLLNMYNYIIMYIKKYIMWLESAENEYAYSNIRLYPMHVQ